MKKINKRIKWFIIIFVLILIPIFLAWYLAPIEQNISTSLSSLEGEQLDITFNVNWQRHTTRPTDLRGKITIDDRVYDSIHNTNHKVNYGNYFDRLMMKLRNESPVQWFITPTYETFFIEGDHIQIYTINRDFDSIHLAIQRDGEFTGYFGPAETAEEADIIAKSIFE